MKKKSWLEKIAFSKGGVHYTWWYVIFLLIPALAVVMVVMIYTLSKYW